jgi:NADPH2:quinone reductase
VLALLPTGRSDPLVEPAELPTPEPAPDEALIAVDAFSLNRGETFLLGDRRIRGNAVLTIEEPLT